MSRRDKQIEEAAKVLLECLRDSDLGEISTGSWPTILPRVRTKLEAAVTAIADELDVWSPPAVGYRYRLLPKHNYETTGEWHYMPGCPPFVQQDVYEWQSLFVKETDEH